MTGIVVLLLLVAASLISIPFSLTLLFTGAFPSPIRIAFGAGLVTLTVGAVGAFVWLLTGSRGPDFIAGPDVVGGVDLERLSIVTPGGLGGVDTRHFRR